MWAYASSQSGRRLCSDPPRKFRGRCLATKKREKRCYLEMVLQPQLPLSLFLWLCLAMALNLDILSSRKEKPSLWCGLILLNDGSLTPCVGSFFQDLFNCANNFLSSNCNWNHWHVDDSFIGLLLHDCGIVRSCLRTIKHERCVQ